MVKRARTLWLEARVADVSAWPDVAVRMRDDAQKIMKAARWIKRERIKAGVYGK